MENRPPSPEDTSLDKLDDDAEDEAPQRVQHEGLLHSFLTEHFDDEHESVEDDDDDEEEDEKDEKPRNNHKRQSSVGRFLQGLGFSEDAPQEKEDEEPQKESTAQRVPVAPVIPTPVEIPIEAPEVAVEEPAEEGVEQAPVDVTEVSEAPTTEVEPDDEEEEDDQGVPAQNTPPTPPVPPINVPPQTPNVTPPTPNTPPPPTPPINPGGAGAAPNIMPPAGTTNPNTLNPAAPNVQITNIDNRPSLGPAIVGSVIVDQLSRGRDRRLAQEIEKQAEISKKDHEEKERQLTELAHKQRHEARERERLAHQMKEQVSAPEKPVQKEAPEPLLARVLERPPAAETEVKAPEVTVEAPRVEHGVERTQQFVTTEVAPEVKNEPESVDSKIVLQQVEQAAERDIPVERFYEQSHELKDEPTSYHARGPITGWGDQRADTQHHANGSSAVHDHLNTSVKSKASDGAKKILDNPVYKKAAISGVITGLVIIGAMVAFILIS